MADKAGITAEEFSSWKSARKALESVAEFAGDRNTAVHGIMDRLRNSMLRAAAGTIVVKVGSRETERHSVAEIGHHLWMEYDTEYLSRHALWRIGDAEIETHPRGVNSLPTTFFLYDVRFDPEGLTNWIRPPAKLRPDQLTTPPSLPESDKPEGSDKNLPPVAKAHLDKWAELYKQVYRGSEDTEPNAIASAKGMFQGRHVSRAKVRAYFPARKRGPKVETAE